MTTKTINCAECNVEFTFEENPKYPRKYCLNCSAKKKQQWNVKGEQKYVEPHTEGYGAPVEKISEPLPPQGTFPPKSKEYHLSPEQVRSNALDLAIKAKELYPKVTEFKDIFDMARDIEDWINGN